MNLKIDIQGEKAIIKMFEKFGEKALQTISDITKIKALETEAEAKRLAPVDFGELRQQIKAQKIDDFTHRVTAYAKHSPYQEFGTGGLVDVPVELKGIALQFKGKGTRKINMKPQPFMYPAFLKARRTYAKDVDKALEILLKNG